MFNMKYKGAYTRGRRMLGILNIPPKNYKILVLRPIIDEIELSDVEYDNIVGEYIGMLKYGYTKILLPWMHSSY